MPRLFQTIDKIRPLYDFVYRIVLVICKILLIADILISVYAVIGRYVPNFPSTSWAEQVVLTCMVYLAVLSAALAIRDDSHIRMTVFDRYLPTVVVKVLDVISDLAVMALGIVLLVYGKQVCSGRLVRGFYESMPWLSRFWMYFPVPLAGGAMIVFELESLYSHIKAFWIPEEKEEKEV